MTSHKCALNSSWRLLKGLLKNTVAYLDELRARWQPQLDGVGLPAKVDEADEGERSDQERAGDRQHRVPGHEAAVPDIVTNIIL